MVVAADGDIPSLRIIGLLFENCPEHVASVDFAIGGSAGPFDRMAGKDRQLLIVRSAELAQREPLMRMAIAGESYVYFIDDNFWLLNGDSPLEHYYQHPFVRDALELGLSGAHTVVCHSERFREMLLRYNRNVAVIPPHFDFRVLASEPPTPPADEIRIGIVANISRAADIAFLVPVVREVLARSGSHVVFEFFGYTPPELSQLPGVRSLDPVQDYRSFIRLKQARGWLLALAPLHDTPFAQYKTNNKFREFGACGIAGLYSDTPVYRESVRDGETGFLVPNVPERWTERILACLAQPQQTARIGAAAHDWVKLHHDMPQVRRQWLDVLHDARAAGPRGALQRGAGLLRLAKRRLTRARLHLLSGDGRRRRTKFPDYGYPRGAVAFELMPGQSLETTVHTFCDAEHSFSFMVGTYHRKVRGRLELSFALAQGEHRVTIPLDRVRDNEPLTVRVPASGPGAVKARLTNLGTEDLAVFACTRLAASTFPYTGRSYPFGFLA